MSTLIRLSAPMQDLAIPYFALMGVSPQIPLLLLIWLHSLGATPFRSLQSFVNQSLVLYWSLLFQILCTLFEAISILNSSDFKHLPRQNAFQLRRSLDWRYCRRRWQHCDSSATWFPRP
jgi:hypothetical protein